MKNIAKIKATYYRHFHAAMAAQLVFAILVASLPFGLSGTAGAVQFTSRSIRMSDSAPGNSSVTTGVGSGRNVSYAVTYTTTNTATSIAGIVIDFCTNSPLPGEACTAPTGFDVNKSTTQIYNQVGLGTGAMAVSTSGGTANRIVISRATPAAPSATSSFELGNGTSNGFKNPDGTASTAYTFYARIYTYSTQAGATGAATTPAGYTDYGGLALATATVITITARVQENLTFCMSAASPTSNCGGISAPAITLGHGTTTKVIDSTAVDTGVIYSQVSTNASGGAIVRLRTSNSCGGLSSDGGSTCDIQAANSGGSGTPPTLNAGTSSFGLAVAPGSGMTSSTAAFGGSAGSSQFGMDTTSANNVTTAFGASVIASTGPISNVNSTWTFGASASNVTPAGIYSANLSAIATGQF